MSVIKPSQIHLTPIFFTLFFLTFLAGQTYAADKPIIFVSILPQKFFVEQIAGDKVNVKVMVEPGQVPELYEPTPQKMAALAKAQRYFKIGMTFEQKLLDSIADVKVVEAPIEDMEAHQENEVGHESALELNVQGEHEDGHEDEHEAHDEHQSQHQHKDEHEDEHHKKDEHDHHHAHDPHIWLDPVSVLKQGEIIYHHLLQLMPNEKADLETNYLRFKNRVNELHHELEHLFSKKAQNHFLIFHPALGHFAERYGLHQVAIENEGKLPSAKYMAVLINELRDKRVKFIIVEVQFSQKEARTIAAQLNAKLLSIDPLGEDYFNNMQHIATRIKKALY